MKYLKVKPYLFESTAVTTVGRVYNIVPFQTSTRGGVYRLSPTDSGTSQVLTSHIVATYFKLLD